MIKLYANNLGWVGAYNKKTGEIVYTDNKDAAMRFRDTSDSELVHIAREIERQGHNLDKVVCRDRW